MARLAASAVLAAVALAFLSPALAEPADLDPSVMAAGDECATGSDDGRCSLNALQVRGVKAHATAHSNSSCSGDTSGTCRLMGCSGSRGPAECYMLKGFKCICPEGWCAVKGTCVPAQGHCSTNTGGTCEILGCDSSRGATSCESGQCVCKAGHCAFRGKCYPSTATGGT